MLLKRKLYGPQVELMVFHSAGSYFVYSNKTFSAIIMKVAAVKVF
jgi:hypothetical protein